MKCRGHAELREAPLKNKLTYSMQVMNINLRPKKCSSQSRYGRYGATAKKVHTWKFPTVALKYICNDSFTDVLSVYCGCKMNWEAASQVALCN